MTFELTTSWWSGAALCFVAQATLGQSPLRGFADDVLGRWDVTVGSGARSYPSWVEIRLHTEGTLMGRFVGRFGSVRHLSRVVFDNDVLEFEVAPQYERQREGCASRDAATVQRYAVRRAPLAGSSFG